MNLKELATALLDFTGYPAVEAAVAEARRRDAEIRAAAEAVRAACGARSLGALNQ
jgi:hypothetical protein